MAALLSVALLPIGLIAVIQTQSVASTARANAELALLAMTQQAATDERLALVQATGGADALAVVVPDLIDDTGRCASYMRRFVDRSERFSFAGFLPVSGIMTCSSVDKTYDFSRSEDLARRIADPAPRIAINRDGPVSNTSVIVASTPVFDVDGSLLGFMTISIPHARIKPSEAPTGDALLELITFNSAGDILTATGDLAEAPGFLPADRPLTDLAAMRAPTALRLTDVGGSPRLYTVAPIETGEVYVMGIWSEDAGVTDPTLVGWLATLFPALMWAVSLLVSLFAVHRLVIRHLQSLGRQMALFAAARRLPAEAVDQDPPTEILRMQKAFHRMTEALIRDEASLENAIREKSVLVKEIHHRVKNNLQLISSIIALQVRDADSAEAKSALRQTQDRVLSMATIHRDLYQTSETGLVDVGHLMREVVSKSIEVAPEHESIDLKMEIDDIWLYPDQAVPMSLLASEAVINALKHMPAEDAAQEDRTEPVDRWIRISFHKDVDRACHFKLVNATGSLPMRQGKGMGRKLIRAFATQLNAAVKSRHDADSYTLSVDFEASEFAPAPGTF